MSFCGGQLPEELWAIHSEEQSFFAARFTRSVVRAKKECLSKLITPFYAYDFYLFLHSSTSLRVPITTRIEIFPW